MRIKMGIISGAVATFVAGSMLLMNNALHRFPEVRVARTLAEMLGEPGHVMVGVTIIAVVGVFLFGGLFGAFEHRIPLRSYVAKGVALGIASWLLMMLVYMPLAGAGLFGLERSPLMPGLTLVLNLAYWLVLALYYRWVMAPVDASGRVEA